MVSKSLSEIIVVLDWGLGFVADWTGALVRLWNDVILCYFLGYMVDSCIYLQCAMMQCLLHPERIMPNIYRERHHVVTRSLLLARMFRFVAMTLTSSLLIRHTVELISR